MFGPLDSYALHPGQRIIIKTGLAIKLLPTTAQEQFALANGLSWYWRAAEQERSGREDGDPRPRRGG